jgi:glycosyltransferase involved in cell wall biosynthesis
MIVKISIIIPCFNSEATLEGTLKSVLDQDFEEWEAIIVNDGSPDNLQTIALKYVDKDTRFKYFKKENGGLGAARNFGIKKSTGIFILPLDSDNQIEKDFVLHAIAVFENDKNVGVVHGNAEYYGEKKGLWEVGKFDLNKMLVHNYIDACAIYRKSLWEQVGGYDENMPYQGHEDWEFWISLATLKIGFHHLQKITFNYYVSDNSMIRSFTDEMVSLNQDYIVKKHCRFFHENYCRLVEKNNNLVSSQNKIKDNFLSKLKSEKFAVDLVCSNLFGFKIFNNKFDDF